MTNDQIEERFKTLTTNKDTLISSMGLNMQDYQKMQGIMKKKVIMNIEGIS